MTVKEIYAKYKHLDRLLSDREWIEGDNEDSSAFRLQLLYDLWQAIKQQEESHG